MYQAANADSAPKSSPFSPAPPTLPIWQPYVEGSFRGGGITERGKLDVFMPLMWSDNALLFADLRGRIGDTGHHEGNWSVAANLFRKSEPKKDVSNTEIQRLPDKANDWDAI